MAKVWQKKQTKISQKCAVTKVHQLDTTVCGQEDVVALDVTMDYSVVVEVLETLGWREDETGQGL